MIEIAQQLSKDLPHTTETFSDPEKLYITFFYRICPSEGPDEEVCILYVTEDSIKIIDIISPKRHHILYVEEYAGILINAVNFIDQARVRKQEKFINNIDKAIAQAQELLEREK